jgi:hypothetical protein
VPRLRRKPRGGGVATAPALGRAHREGAAPRPPLHAAAPAFVPYVGCLADRDAALAVARRGRRALGLDVRLDFPTLHSACCGALGGMYRGATKGSERLLRYAAEQAPVVTPCVLCRDNVRSAARQLKLDVPVHFWPEFFAAAETVPGGLRCLTRRSRRPAKNPYAVIADNSFATAPKRDPSWSSAS